MTQSRTLKPHQRLPLAAGALMIWIALGPWIWGFAGSRSAVANHIFFTLAFGPLALMVAALRPAAFTALAGGVWLAVSPWVLGYASNDAAWLNELVSGGLLVVLCANAPGIALMSRLPRRATGTAAGAAAGVETVASRS